MTFRFITAFLEVSVAFSSALADTFTYNNGTLDRNQAFRYGQSEEQGMAMRLSAEKLGAMRDAEIKSISAAFGSKRTTDNKVTLFIAESLESEPLYTQDATITSQVNWLEFELAAPYKITGKEKELYIGYNAQISSNSSMMMADLQQDSPNTSFYFADGAWADMYGSGRGAASLRIGVDGVSELTDILIKPVEVEGYFQVNKTYDFNAEVFNFGNQTVNSLEVKVSTPNSEPEVKLFDGLNLAPGSAFEFSIENYTCALEGLHPISFEISKVNGKADNEPSDNSYASSIFFYSENMERGMMIEGFTGQACSNCPAGHRAMETFLESHPEENFIEVMHHIGYQVDDFTMDSDYNFLYLYNSTSTFAPAFTINRTHAPKLGSAPVVFTDVNNMEEAYQKVMTLQPYVSLSLDTSFDTETRVLNAKLGVYVHNDLPADVNVFNLYLIQDSLVRNQTGGGRTYVHNAVYRGNLAGNSWGYLIDDKLKVAGSYFEWATTYELPDSIISDYNGVENGIPIVAVPENMKLVGMVGALDPYNPCACPVYNAIAAPFGETATQGGMVASVNDVKVENKTLDAWVDSNRTLQIRGDYEKVEVYDMTGRKADWRQPLSHGIYVVRAISGGVSLNKKLIVR